MCLEHKGYNLLPSQAQAKIWMYSFAFIHLAGISHNESYLKFSVEHSHDRLGSP